MLIATVEALSETWPTISLSAVQLLNSSASRRIGVQLLVQEKGSEIFSKIGFEDASIVL